MLILPVNIFDLVTETERIFLLCYSKTVSKFRVLNKSVISLAKKGWL